MAATGRGKKQILNSEDTIKLMMKRFSLLTYPIEGKTVILRVDFNVPLDSQRKVTNQRKIKETLPTIRYLLEKNCKIVILTHLGRPQGKIAEELRIRPLAQELKRFLPKTKINLFDDCLGPEIKTAILNGKQQEIFFLENVRFYQEEEENDLAFAHSLADLGEIYVNDAFGVYGEHASVDAITRFLPAMAGFLVERELQQLSKALRPVHPSVWMIGGAKLTKVDLIRQALRKADYVLIGGALAFAFLKAKGLQVGNSKIDHDSVLIAKKILKKWNARKIILPIDFMATTTFSRTAKITHVKSDQIQPEQICLDLGPKTIELFKQYLRKAQTIVWNGPLGYFEWVKFATATREIARFISRLTAMSICGGGETAEAIERYHVEGGITHLSTGGGAALLFLSGKKIPSITALEKNYQHFRKKVKSKESLFRRRF